MSRSRAVSAGPCQGTPSGSSSMSSSKAAICPCGRGRFHQSQFFLTSVGRTVEALLSVPVNQGSGGVGRITVGGIGTRECAATTNRRGRDCGTNPIASMTRAPKRYPCSAIAEAIVRKSRPSRDVKAPQTFSSTIIAGARRSAARACSSSQNAQKVPERAPCRPAPLPASDRSWHGNDAHARSAAPGRSPGVNSATSASLKSRPPQFSI